MTNQKTSMHYVPVSGSLVDLVSMATQLCRTVRALEFMNPIGGNPSLLLSDRLPHMIASLFKQYSALVLDQDMRELGAAEQSLVRTLGDAVIGWRDSHVMEMSVLESHADVYLAEKRRGKADEIRDSKITQEV